MRADQRRASAASSPRGCCTAPAADGEQSTEIPLVNIEWKVTVPDGYEAVATDGTLEPKTIRPRAAGGGGHIYVLGGGYVGPFLQDEAASQRKRAAQARAFAQDASQRATQSFDRESDEDVGMDRDVSRQYKETPSNGDKGKAADGRDAALNLDVTGNGVQNAVPSLRHCQKSVPGADNPGEPLSHAQAARPLPPGWTTAFRLRRARRRRCPLPQPRRPVPSTLPRQCPNRKSPRNRRRPEKVDRQSSRKTKRALACWQPGLPRQWKTPRRQQPQDRYPTGRRRATAKERCRGRRGRVVTFTSLGADPEVVITLADGNRLDAIGWAAGA